MSAAAGTPGFSTAGIDYVPETKFGLWFQRTDIWYRYVVSAAATELKSLLPADAPSSPRVLDVGCGDGVAFGLLSTEFGAREIIAVDGDPESVGHARRRAGECGIPVAVQLADAAALPLPDASVDLVFCHQVLHHVTDPVAVLREIRRVLAPRGWLLVAESCLSFLEWWPVRVLFRHPPREQYTASQYVDLVRAGGFEVSESCVMTPAPWWSQRDLGYADRRGRPVSSREPTQVRIAARAG